MSGVCVSCRGKGCHASWCGLSEERKAAEEAAVVEQRKREVEAEFRATHQEEVRAAHSLLAMDRARMDFLNVQYCGVDFEHADFPGGVLLIRIPEGGRVGPDLRKTVDDLRELP